MSLCSSQIFLIGILCVSVSDRENPPSRRRNLFAFSAGFCISIGYNLHKWQESLLYLPPLWAPLTAEVLERVCSCCWRVRTNPRTPVRAQSLEVWHLAHWIQDIYDKYNSPEIWHSHGKTDFELWTFQKAGCCFLPFLVVFRWLRIPEHRNQVVAESYH